MTSKRSIYFGYGSNLWLRQMQLRCPDSIYMGVGMLPGWRLQINQRGYCNVVQMKSDMTVASPTKEPGESSPIEEVVYGLVYSLSHDDEERLDINEGVPDCYEKEIIPVYFWASEGGGNAIDTRKGPEHRDMLVYVDRLRMTDSNPKTEYIYRMNMGIADALKMGVPNDYIRKVVRKYIPADSPMDERDRREAEQQAVEFKDK